MERKVSEAWGPKEIGGLTWVAERQVLLEPDRAAEWDPFILWGWDRFRAPQGFPDHPHRGFETVTLVLAGSLQHRDTRGNRGVLETGDVQWMTAGRGILHSEMPAGDEEVIGLQLWVNLPARLKMSEPRYQDLPAARIPRRTVPGAELKVISGSSGDVAAPTANHVPVIMLEIHAEAGACVVEPLPASYNAFVHVVRGRARIGEEATPLADGQIARLTAGESVRIVAETELHAILLAGEPIGEPIAVGGPFVMTTREEVAKAHADHAAGVLGR